MKDIKEFISESLLLESYDATNVIKQLMNIKEFDNSIKASDKPNKLYVLMFNKTNGEFVEANTYDNDNTMCNKYDYCIYCADKNLFWTESNKWSDCSLAASIIDNTKKRGIIIGYYNEANTEIIKQFVKDNLKLFDKSSVGLTKDEIDELDKFFTTNVKYYEKILDNKTFAVYFPSREEQKNLKSRVGLNNIPHITISKPNGYKGNFKVTSYKTGNWAGTEWPDTRRMMNADGTPKYSNIDSIIDYLQKTISNFGDKLGVELKN